jgi:ribosomal protein S27E
MSATLDLYQSRQEQEVFAKYSLMPKCARCGVNLKMKGLENKRFARVTCKHCGLEQTVVR